MAPWIERTSLNFHDDRTHWKAAYGDGQLKFTEGIVGPKTRQMPKVQNLRYHSKFCAISVSLASPGISLTHSGRVGITWCPVPQEYTLRSTLEEEKPLYPQISSALCTDKA